MTKGRELGDTEEEVETSSEEQDPPTLKKVIKAIKKLRNNSPGTDGIPAEFYKCGGETLVAYLWRLMVKVWEQEAMPDEWGVG